MSNSAWFLLSQRKLIKKPIPTSREGTLLRLPRNNFQANIHPRPYTEWRFDSAVDSDHPV